MSIFNFCFVKILMPTSVSILYFSSIFKLTSLHSYRIFSQCTVTSTAAWLPSMRNPLATKVKFIVAKVHVEINWVVAASTAKAAAVGMATKLGFYLFSIVFCSHCTCYAHREKARTKDARTFCRRANLFVLGFCHVAYAQHFNAIY